MHLDGYIREQSDRYLDGLESLLRVRSVSTDAAHRGDMERAAELTASLLSGAGIDAAVQRTAGHPVVVGHGPEVAGAPRVLIYGHYDVQPADPIEAWDGDPFEPRRVDGAIVARGANDDKGQFMAHIAAVDALRAVDGTLPVNVTFLIEGEEEVGSPNLPAFLRAHRQALRCDTIVVSDGTLAEPGVPGITYGIRGSCTVRLEAFGADGDLHSGNVGGAVPNALHALVTLVAGMKDGAGRVQIPGFYDRVRVDEAERGRIAAMPFDAEAFKDLYGVRALVGEDGWSTYERMWVRPTLELIGLAGGHSGPGVKTVVPARAEATLSARLVPDQDPVEVADAVRAYVESRMPAGVRVTVTASGGAKPALMDVNGQAFRYAAEAAEAVWGTPTRYVRGGGSIGIIATFQDVFGVDPVLLGFGDKDDRIHGPNEKFGVVNYINGIRTSARFLRAMGGVERIRHATCMND